MPSDLYRAIRAWREKCYSGSIEKIASALDTPLSKLFEKPDDTNTCDSIPLKCYEFFSAKSKAEQEQLYRILMDMDNNNEDNQRPQRPGR